LTARLEVRGVDKRFGATHAVRGASLAFEAGRIHAVVGENGAGKSTLLRIAAGLLVPDGGGTWIDGRPLAPQTPAEAIRRGVGMVQQHFALVEAFTALENIVLGVEPRRGPFGALDLDVAARKIEAIARELDVAIPLDARVASLGVGDRQRLEIARTLYRDAQVVILDEPTTVLTAGEADALYATLRRLAEAGRAVVVVTHKLDEVRDHADVATVMRRGAIVETRSVERTAAGARALADAVMGGEAAPAVERSERRHGEVVLRIERLIVGRALRGVDLEVRAGEVVGVAGVEGNGQRELVRALAGLEPVDGGSVRPEPGAIAVVHEDRQHEGLVLDAPIRDNVLLGDFAAFTHHGVLDGSAMDREASARASRAQGPRELDRPARTLSGGNQQKLVVARAIARVAKEGAPGGGRPWARARVLVLAHPTRGVDLAASRAIHAEVLAAAVRGAAVVVLSSDLHELRTVSDRLVVMARGRVVAELPTSATDAEIGRAMLGGAQAGLA
jgi:simple sugar transport system ATP-binding protein